MSENRENKIVTTDSSASFQNQKKTQTNPTDKKEHVCTCGGKCGCGEKGGCCGKHKHDT